MILLLLIAIPVVVAISRSVASAYEESVAIREQTLAEERERREEEEKTEKPILSYGDDPTGRYLTRLAQNSKIGAKEFLDGIPVEKTYSKKQMGSHIYETVSWVETGDDRVRNGGRFL